MAAVIIDIESLEFPEETLDLLTEDAFDNEESIEQRIVNVLTEHYSDKL